MDEARTRAGDGLHKNIIKQNKQPRLPRRGKQYSWQVLARQGRAGQGRAGQGRAGQGKARQGKVGQGKARQGKARQGKARQGRAGTGNIRQRTGIGLQTQGDYKGSK